MPNKTEFQVNSFKLTAWHGPGRFIQITIFKLKALERQEQPAGLLLKFWAGEAVENAEREWRSIGCLTHNYSNYSQTIVWL